MNRSKLIQNMAKAFETKPGGSRTTNVPTQDAIARATAALKEVEKYLGRKVNEVKDFLDSAPPW
jgi:hypothetical protein